jgi:outer membrane protein OmpA-like peptidoglycan-associated protein
MRRRVVLANALLGLFLAACQSPQADLAREPVRVVFFTEDSAAMDESGLAVVADATALARANPNAPVRVLGFAAPEHSRAYNQALSDARARHVADTMVAQGIAANRIQIRARGPVAFELVPIESRRVEIRVGG